MFKSASEALEERRQHETHQQQLRFNEDKHQVDMERLSLQLQQAQQSFSMKQQQQADKDKQQQEAAEQKNQADQQQQAEQQQQAAQQQAGQQQAQVQQNDMQRQNIMAKAAAMYTDDLEPMPLSSGAPSAALGAGMGGAAAHYMFPTEATKGYREMANAIPKGKSSGAFKAVKDISHGGKDVRFKAPGPIRKNYFQNRALQSNAKRLLKGTGLGLLAGLIAHSATKE